MGRLLNRDDILNLPAVGCELVEVPEWGGSVWVRGLTARRRNAFVEAIHVGGKRREDWMELLVATCCVVSNTDHGPLFTAQDVELLGEKDPRGIDRLFQAACRLSGIDVDPEAAAKN